MLKKTAFTIVVMLIATALLGENEVYQFTVDYFYRNDSYENTEIRDLNGDLCALIKLDYDINQDIVFSDADVRHREVKADENVIDFYLDHWSKSVTIGTEGFMPLKYPFPENLEAGVCYSMGIKVPPEFYYGTIIVNPNPPDARITLIYNNSERFEQTGASRFKDMQPGYYQLVAEHPDCTTKEESFELGRSEEKVVSIQLPNTKLYFTLDIPTFMFENLDIEVCRDSSFNVSNMVKYNLMDNRIVTGEAGEYYYRISKFGRTLYRGKTSVFSDNIPVIKLNTQVYYAPSYECELYVNGKLYDKGKELFLISSHSSEFVKLNIPGYTGLAFTESFDDENHVKELRLGEDFYSSGFGIGLKKNESKVFYGIKLPLLISPSYHSMNGVEINIWNAGNSTEKATSGYFNGLAMAGFSICTSNDLSGIAMSGFLTSSGGKLSGFSAASFLVTCKDDMNGISLGSINIVGGRAFGAQIGLINYAKDLKGVQLGLLNIIDDGVGGGIPVLPIMNLKF